jgi:hypothetical protein
MWRNAIQNHEVSETLGFSGTSELHLFDNPGPFEYTVFGNMGL